MRCIHGTFKRQDSPTHITQINNISKLETRRKIARIKLLHSVYKNSIRVNPSKYLPPLSRRPTRSSHPLSLFTCTITQVFIFPRAIVATGILCPLTLSQHQIFVMPWSLISPPERIVFDLRPLFVLPCSLKYCKSFFFSIPLLLGPYYDVQYTVNNVFLNS